jgi:hypothetical protein
MDREQSDMTRNAIVTGRVIDWGVSRLYSDRMFVDDTCL